MSLWEKWEREKLAKQGIKIEEPRDVNIQPTRVKADFRRQTWIVVGAFFACLAVVVVTLILGRLVGWDWSDSYVVRLLATKEAQRESLSGNP
ncbi:MAG: hypothetical protein LBT65_10950 [Synergistaceae bacterium]|jgi:uncharacterized DUF497 family protein|nr:hypothetical protein [Synergistaceae bacterium]